MDQAAALRELVSSRDVPADVAMRGRIVLWSVEGRRRKDIAELLGVSLPTVDRWKRRYAEHGLAGLEGQGPGGGREQVPARVRARVIALTRMTPPDGTGLSHWSTRELAKYLKRTEGVTVSWHYIARIWREENLKPHRSGTFKISKDPAFAQKVADVIGLYLEPPGGAVVLSIDEKTQVQALDRTQVDGDDASPLMAGQTRAGKRQQSRPVGCHRADDESRWHQPALAERDHCGRVGQGVGHGSAPGPGKRGLFQFWGIPGSPTRGLHQHPSSREKPHQYPKSRHSHTGGLNLALLGSVSPPRSVEMSAMRKLDGRDAREVRRGVPGGCGPDRL